LARRKKFIKKPRVRDPRTNRQIRAPRVKLVIEGEGIRELDTREALVLAQEAGLDLVEVSGDQDTPVCKIIDFGKWKFEQQKKKKDQAKNQHTIKVKEIKLRPKIGLHDYEMKRNHAQQFLEKGDKVKVSLRFRGREITHPELGMRLMQRIAKDVEAVGVVETPPKMEGRQIIMVMGPRPGAVKKKVTPKPASKPASKPTSEKASGSQASESAPARPAVEEATPAADQAPVEEKQSG